MNYEWWMINGSFTEVCFLPNRKSSIINSKWQGFLLGQYNWKERALHQKHAKFQWTDSYMVITTIKGAASGCVRRFQWTNSYLANTT